ncbi:MAG: YicC family protein [Deltaproteobacteria bacterium]|nr:YicC family protein [Deltaproteobacteria bacterium]
MGKARAVAKKGGAGRGVQVVSMTGYGHATAKRAGISVEVEVRTVNSRYLDCTLKLPRPYTIFEPELRERAAAKLQRGRVEISVSRTVQAAQRQGLRFDKALFEQYLKVYRSAYHAAGAKEVSLENTVQNILARREVLDIGEIPAQLEQEKTLLWEGIDAALADLDSMRRSEGKRLGLDMLQRVETLRGIRSEIARKALRAPEELQNRLQERMNKLLAAAHIDESRICAEAALLAEKVDVSEELVRLDSHFAQFESTLAVTPNGRKLDFLLQEFGREFNTISSKAQDAAIQSAVVDAKTEIEKLREQVQNVE